MGGSQLDRFKNQVTIVCQTKFNPNTKPGKVRLSIAVFFVFLFALVVSQQVGNSSKAVSNNGFKSPVTFVDDGLIDDEDDEDSDGSLIDDEREDGDEDDEDEDSEDGDSSNRQENLESEQKERLVNHGPEILKIFDKYRDNTEIHDHLTLLQEKYSSIGLVRSTKIGSTYEKQDLYAYTLGRGRSGRSMVVIGTEHASEWLSTMSLVYFATRMVQLYAINPDVTDIMDALSIYLIPVSNPDGLRYTMTSKHHGARYWQKNMEPAKVKGHKVKGGDIEMDWDDFVFAESQAIRDFIESKGRVDAFVTVHCCGGGIVKPVSTICLKPEGAVEQSKVASFMAEAMRSPSWAYKQLAQPKSKSKSSSSGKSLNWALNSKRIALSFAIEGRPQTSKKKSSKKAVEIPTTEIIDASRDITKGILKLGTYVNTDYTRSNVFCGPEAEVEEEEEPEQPASNEDDDAGDEDDESAGEDSEDEEDMEEASEDTEEGDEEDVEEEDSTQDDEGDNVEDADADDDSDMDEQATDDDEDSEDTEEIVVTSDSKPSAFSRTEQVQTAALRTSDLPPADESGDYILYYAYGPDMLYELLLNAGVVSAWKVANAKLLQYQFDYTYYSKKLWKSGVADLIKSKHSSLWGVVYRIKKSELTELDYHNLVAAGRTTRLNVTVTDRHGQEYKAFTYRFKSKMSGVDILGKYRRFSPSRQYRNCVIKGAKQQRLPREYIEKLRAISPLFMDKIGSTFHRNPSIGTLCDK